tara:strand:+ start:976 stop:1080 length:105 start_codon:yes stop_codon:yes gene_type:complete
MLQSKKIFQICEIKKEQQEGCSFLNKFKGRSIFL